MTVTKKQHSLSRHMSKDFLKQDVKNNTETEEQLMVVTSGIWKPSLLSGAQSLSLFCVERRSAAMDTYLKRKSMTHIWSSHLFLPKPESLKCLSVSRCPPRIHIHTLMQAHAHANTQIHTINRPLKFPHCPVSATHPSSSTVSLLSKTF